MKTQRRSSRNACISVFAKCWHVLVNVISKPGLLNLLGNKAADVKTDALNWYGTAKADE
jgi:hypothetical protein